MNLLIIDDDRLLTEQIKNALAQHGHITTVVNKASQVVEKLDNLGDYDCVILDLMMRKPVGIDVRESEETGEALYREIKKTDKNKPVIIITGKDKSDIKTNFDSKGTKVLCKPLDAKLAELQGEILRL